MRLAAFNTRARGTPARPKLDNMVIDRTDTALSPWTVSLSGRS